MSRKQGRSVTRWALVVLGAALAALPQHTLRAQSGSDAKKENAGPAKTAGSDAKKENAGPAKTAGNGAEKEDAGPAKTVKTYQTANGTQTISRIEERERKKTADGEVVTERVRMPAYAGDNRVLIEREIRTRKLPDGTLQRETILKNPDANGGMQPIEITRETIRPTNGGSTTEREVSKPDLNGGWRTVRRETEHETGHETAAETLKQTTKEVEEPSVNGGWRAVTREYHWDSKTPKGEETRTVRQVPDASGDLADYEVRTEKVSQQPDGTSREVTLTRRDFQDTDVNRFQVVERTVTNEQHSPGGDLRIHTATESDLVNGGAARNLESAHPEVVEAKTTVESKEKDGTVKTTTTVNRRGSAEPGLHPSHQIVQQRDPDGHVRQIYLPAR